MDPKVPKPIVDRVTILSMAIFVILSLSAVIFLWYQNQQLKKMILSYQTQQVQPTPNPLSSDASAKDETSDWKKYVNKKYGFELSYPKNLSVENYNNDSGATIGDVANIRIGERPSAPEFLSMPFENYVKIAGPQEIQNYEKLNSISEIMTDSGIIGYKTKWEVIPFGDISKKTESTITFFKINDNKYNSKHIEISLYSNDEVTYNQILSTFKFLDASPTPISKACTMEAKLCPDGSSVSRIGPNCDFSPCPTP